MDVEVLGFLFLLLAIWSWLVGTKEYLKEHRQEATEFLYARALALFIDLFRAVLIKAEVKDQLPILIYLHGLSLIGLCGCVIYIVRNAN